MQGPHVSFLQPVVVAGSLHLVELSDDLTSHTGCIPSNPFSSCLDSQGSAVITY